MDEIIKKIKTRRKRGYRMGGKELKIIGYADDAIITAETEDDLQRILQNCSAIQYVTVSIEKTKTLVMVMDPRRCNKIIIEQVAKVDYLGIKISSGENVEEENNWNNYIKRMTDNRVVKIPRDNTLADGRSPTGRPSKRWCDDIKRLRIEEGTGNLPTNKKEEKEEDNLVGNRIADSII
jgi:hypothetical protein